MLADADSAAAAEQVLERDAEVADRIHVTWGRITLADRLAAADGSQVRIHVRAGGEPLWVAGSVADAGRDWCKIATSSGPIYVNVEQIISVAGLSGAAADPEQRSAISAARGFTQILRPLCRGGISVMAVTTDGRHLTGHIDRVGADHLDLATPRGSLCLHFRAISLVKVP